MRAPCAGARGGQVLDLPAGRAAGPGPAVWGLHTSGRMKTCEVCGNQYDKAFEVVAEGTRHVFDCFACAIHALAPRCKTCGTTIIGHGMESGASFYCCAHCARKAGVPRCRTAPDA